MQRLFVAGALTVLTSPAFAQAPDSRLATPTGQEASVSVGGYRYVEPLTPPISIHGVKVAGEYGITQSIGQRRRWFVRATGRAVLGNVTYDGSCRPWLITSNSASPNGYALGLGPTSPCGESGNHDWYLEGRAVAGRDLIRGTWGLSPYAGVGLRHLSNGIAGISGYRTDEYLYLPVGLTTRTGIGARGTLGLTVEYDHLLRGWQKTRQSRFGGGTVPATATAPSFTIEGFSDVSFEQHAGWAFRASAKYQVTNRWSFEPYYIHWSVDDSPVNAITATFTVSGVTARQQLGFYEPFNTTNEWGVRLGVRF
jgi:hypothetical protein